VATIVMPNTSLRWQRRLIAAAPLSAPQIEPPPPMPPSL